MGDLSKNFNAGEFACRCGCGLDSISAAVVVSMQAIRDEAGAAVTVVSGLRCRYRNAAVSSVKGEPPYVIGWLGDPSASDHTRGEAVDFMISGFSRDKTFELLKAMYAAGELPFLRYCYRIKHDAKTNVHCSFGGKKRKLVFDEGIHH
ncbi:MAG: hypothetical protein LBU13_03765 [Synergistaceae bacterium]|nr:hypothetical protein [Synergistaceae bacterium]